MTFTERKLEEAQYFLSLLKTEDPYFDYILSAFLNSARSTTWVMKFEFGKVPGWKEWYDSFGIAEEQHLLFSKINDWRILSTKQAGIKTEYHFLDFLIPDEEYYPVLKKLLNEPDGTEFKITLEQIDEPINDEGNSNKENRDDIFVIQGKIKGDNYDSDLSREIILKHCSEYFNVIKKIVIECVGQFQCPI